MKTTCIFGQSIVVQKIFHPLLFTNEYLRILFDIFQRQHTQVNYLHNTMFTYMIVDMGIYKTIGSKYKLLILKSENYFDKH